LDNPAREELDRSPTVCSRCRHTNPPENRFCGRCGASLGDVPEQSARSQNVPAVRSSDLPARLGPAGKAVALGLAALAVDVGLMWLHGRLEKTGRPAPPGAYATRQVEGQRKYLHGYLFQEEVSLWFRDGPEARGRFFSKRITASLPRGERLTSVSPQRERT